MLGFLIFVISYVFFENRVFRNLKIEVINARKRADILIDIPRHMT